VYARELYTAEQFMSNNVTVMVTLTDVNDNSPQFLQPSFEFNVSETAANGTLLGYLNASDLDAGLNGQVKVSLSYASDNGQSVMYIDSNTGELRLKALLTDNAVFVSTYQLVVTATDQAAVEKDRRSNLALVRVNILSASVSPPVFAPAFFTASVTEAAPIGTNVVRLTATHKYPGAVLNYTLLNTIGSDRFTVVTQSNEGFVRISLGLDRETVNFYNLTAVVSDGTMNATAPVYITVLDYNDQTPKFNQSSFNFTVSENLDAPVLLGQIVATDADQEGTSNSEIQYSLMGAQADTYFTVNATTGELFTKLTLDREATPTGFTFAVMARDGGMPALSATVDVRVIVEDVNDNEPLFDASTTATASLVEKGTYADFLQIKFTDADLGSNRDSQFELVSPSDLNGSFVINATTGFLSSTVPLTRSLFGNASRHNITVLVYNLQPMANFSGTNQTFVVSVNLLDSNDNRPIFVQRVFTATVREDLFVGREITSAKANDLDTTAPYSTIVYNITGGNELGKFRLDSSTGSLTLWQSLNYDEPDRNRNFSIQIIAYNPASGSGGSLLNDTAEIQISITDVNDNAPVFTQTQYDFSINETQSTGSVISTAIRATDNDSTPDTTAAVFYELRPSGGPFAIDNATGSFSLASSVSRDDGGSAVHTLQAVAINLEATPQLSAVVTVTVRVANVNNNPPVFSASLYNFSVTENAPLRTSVGTLTVTDRDGDAVTMTVLSGDMFLVDSTSLLTNASIDRESLMENPIVLVVQASDGRYQTNTTVRVTVTDLNDNAPQFLPAVSELTVSVQEAAPNGTSVVKLNSTDPDAGQNGNVTYSILTVNSPFKINALTGEITVANGNLLDYQKQAEIPILVVASDRGQPVQSTMLTLKVQLTDSNDKPVVFNPKVYTATVQENQSPGQFVTRLFASDADTVPAGFNFSLPVAADASLFYLVNATMTKTISLLLNESLDRERQSLYSVTVSVTDGLFNDSAIVNITVGDENDNPPTFQKTAYTFFADEQAPNGQVVGSVKATDADIGFNAQVNYFISGGQDKFAINYSTGEISVRASINGTAGTKYDIIVTARDQGTPSLSGTTTVTVYANQTNSNTPIFSPSIYTVSVNESAPNNTLLVTVKATDADFPSVNGIISYSLLESNSTSGLFSVDSSTGDVSLIGVIDFEKVTSYTVIVLAIDHAAAPRTATAQIFVQVLNEDDTPPEFVPNSYFFYAPQNATVGFAVGSVIAVDPDYPSANPQPLLCIGIDFQLNSTTGALTVSSSLSVTNYFFDAICTDASAMTGNATVTVSVIPSDVYYAKVPQFLSTPLVASVLENQTAYVFVIDVNATINGGAEDAGVLYRLDSGSTIFNISSSLGIVEARPETLDREVNTEVTLIVIAVNTAEPSFSSSQPIRVLLLDINDNAPRFEFSRGEVLLYENATVRHVVTDLQATDPDTSSTNLTYSIVGDNSGGKFRLQSIEPNASQLILDAVVDYEAMSALGYAYSLTIEVSDGSFSSNYSLIVRIGDVNDNPPVFSAPMYNFSVAEQADVGTLVGRVVATDPDTVDLNKLEYAVVDTGNFSMNASTGVISTLTIFDRLITSRFSFNVTCTDTAGNIGWTSVNVDVLDVNNYSPNMTNLPTSWNITENATSLMQSFVIQVVDNDSGQNANVSLSIVSGDSVGSFAINGSRVEVTKVLDRETPGLTVDSSGNGVIKLVMRAADNGVPPRSSTATLTVLLQDINDSPPRFAIPAGRVLQQAESLPVRSTIVTFDMLDADLPSSNNFTFSISSASNPNETFAIDGSNLVLNKALSRVAMPTHNLTIVCFDGVFSVSTFILVTVVDSNNYGPVFTSAVYVFNVTENDLSNATGQFIGVVTAVDRDTGVNGQVTYSVASPSSLKTLLAINETGAVTLNGTVDRETNAELTFFIMATDMGASPRFGTAELHLKILDVNDNKPEFTMVAYTGTVAEGSSAGAAVSFVTAIIATDKDIENNSYVEFSLSGPHSNWFSISQSGQIQVASGALLDRENQSSFSLNVTANNTRGEPTWLANSVPVTIQLSDINDNAPVFTKASFDFFIDFFSPVSQTLGDVTATDADAGFNAQITYFLRGGEDRFAIDFRTGVLTVSKALNGSSSNVFSLVVTARDQGTPSLSGTTTVTVYANQTNSNTPIFSPSIYTVSVNESAPNNTLLVTVKATDADFPSVNGIISYSLLESNSTSGLFSVDSSTGDVSLIGVIDFEKVTSYTVIVLAIDHAAAPRTATAQIFVQVLNEDDTPPEFVPNSYFFYAPQNATVGFAVGSVLAVDPDYPSANPQPVSYSASASDFQLNSTTGALTGWTSVNVDVLDVNNYSPNMTNLPTSWNITENATSLMQSFLIQVVDNDSGQNANVSLSIVSGDSVGSFAINGSRVEVTKVLDRETPGLTVDSSGNGVIKLVMRAADNGVPPRSSTATLTVLLQDINDSPPRFAIPAGRVLQQAESLPVRSTIVTFDMLDADLPSSNNLTFSISSASNLNDTFAIQGSALVLNKALNVRVQSSYNLTIICFDGVFSVSTYINISIATGGGNNYSPKFSSSLYAFYVTENDLSSALNQSIGVVSAEDRDTGLNGQVVYSIASPSSLKHLLAINENGTVTLNGTVDREATPKLTLFLLASDLGTPPRMDTAELQLTVLDVNDNRPEFTAAAYTGSVPEGSTAGVTVSFSTGIDARDKDIENNSYVEFSLSGPHSNWFSISQSGQIQVASGALLDRENQSSFSLNVTANNTRGEPTWLANSIPVTIQLSDINDNAPVFTKASFDFFIDFFSPVSQTLGDVTATDADAGFNAQITYFLRGGEDRFAIDFRTGVLTVSKALNGSSSNVFSLVVTARDQGTPSLSGTTTVTVYANQTNSNTPIFSPSIYTVSVNESAPNNTLLVTVKATDADFPSVNGIISYSLLESNSTSGLFSVDSSTGDVSLIGVIDFEKVTSYTVIVLAIDHAAAPRTATAQIFVQVLNEDDTPPEFVPNSYFFYAPQNATVGFAVGSVIAVDPDYPSANPQPVSYSASASDFQLNSTTGALTVSSSLSVTNYFFDAICTDASAMTGNATVTVSVIPSDVYYAKVPQFLSTPLVASVLENQTAYVFVIDVNATINGGAEDAGVLYRLDSGSTIFNISSSLGIVEARPETLDREVNTEVTLIVIAVNTAEPSFSSSQPIRVLLLDINDNAPRFEFSRGEVLLYENATVRHVVTDLQATDPDTSSTNLTYSIVGDNSGGKFRLQSIEPNASQLILDAVVDYEAMSALGYAYSLTIEVSDGSFSSNYSLIVRIGDVNDNPPVFSAPMYNFSVAEQADVGTLVGRVVATDRILLITSRFSFNVTCTDTAGNIGWTSVNVDVLDVNNYSPNMTNLPTSWNITENATSLMQSFVIQVVDNDSGQNANVSLSIVSGDSVGSFAINGSRVEVTKVLDRETPGLTVDSSGNGVIKLVMRAADNGVPPRSSTATLTVLLQDINDSPPRFAIPAGRVLQQAESLPVRSTIVTFDMLDADLPSSNNFTFSISSASNPNVTVVDSNNYGPVFTSAVYVFNVTENDLSNATGQFIGVVTAVDRDTGLNGQVTYSVASPSNLKTLLAIEKGSAELQLNILDVNDNAPEFTAAQYTGYVAEGSPNGTISPPVQISDRDIGNNAYVEFYLTGLSASQFRINPTSGQIEVASGAVLDRETQPVLSFAVVSNNTKGQPGWLSQTVNITIQLNDINDNAPVFSTSYAFSILENATVMSTVGRVEATDADLGDNATVMYGIAGGADGRFEIQVSSGEIRLSGSLDRETKDFYQLNVTATDRGSPSKQNSLIVNITVLDVNDVVPSFGIPSTDAVTFTVPEEQSVPQTIGRVNASDADLGENSRLTYLIANASVPFNITSDGVVQSSGLLDRESISRYRFVVYASDAGFPSLTGSTVVAVQLTDINDWSPEFSQPIYQTFTLEKAPIGTVLAIVAATDKDIGANANLTYYLQGNGPNTYHVNENSPAGTPVGSVSASVVGTSIVVKYKLDTTNSLFQIDELTGNITVQMGAALDKENTSLSSQLSLTVLAFTDTVPSRQSYGAVRITLTDVNDNQPVFSQASGYSFVVAEELTEPVRIGAVSATDADSGNNALISYSIVGGNTAGVFALNSTTGELTAVSRIDREAVAVYLLQIAAIDNGSPTRLSSTVSATVSLTDVNDNAPVLSIGSALDLNVTEGYGPGYLAAVVTATDADLGLNGSVNFDLIQTDVPPMFYITSNGEAKIVVLKFIRTNGFAIYKAFMKRTGSVLLKTLGTLNYALRTSYQLTIIAYDLGNPVQSSNATIEVSVIKFDTNRPRFTSEFFNTSIADNLPPNTPIFDLPAGPRPFNYTIIDGDSNGAFSITNQGRISITKVLAPPLPRVYTLKISATDELNNTASTILQVWLTSPTTAVFNTTDVTLSWNEDHGSGRELVYDFATVDELLGRTVQYVIQTCSPIGCESLFSIDPATGQFYVMSSLDRETVSKYSFVIRANLPGSSGGSSGRRRRQAIAPPTTDTSSVTLTVTDVNDNPPVFNVPSPFRVGILINSPVDTLVYTPSATDRDSTSVLTYSLSNLTDQFYINLNSAELRTRATFSSSASTPIVGVEVTDGKFNASMVIVVTLLTSTNSLVLTAGITPDVFNRYESLIKTNLSALLGVDFRVAKVTSAVSDSGDSAKVDPTKTDAYIYAYNPTTGTLIEQAELRRIIEAKRAEIAAFFALFGAKSYDGVRTPVLTSGGGVTSTSTGLTAAEIALIVLACLIVVAAIIAIIVLLCWLSKRIKRRWRQLEADEAASAAAAGGGSRLYGSLAPEVLQLQRKKQTATDGGRVNGGATTGELEIAAEAAPAPLAAMELVSNPTYQRNPSRRYPPSQFGSASAVAAAAAAANGAENFNDDSPRRSTA
uniref:CELR3 protein n=1 Tax=Macrostomum lignano TaxID=282301 RepID=A0A1I8HLV4_9PLAT